MKSYPFTPNLAPQWSQSPICYSFVSPPTPPPKSAHTKNLLRSAEPRQPVPASTYQDPMTLLPGVYQVGAVVQGEAHVAWILQLPIGELDCKSVTKE